MTLGSGFIQVMAVPTLMYGSECCTKTGGLKGPADCKNEVPLGSTRVFKTAQRDNNDIQAALEVEGIMFCVCLQIAEI